MSQKTIILALKKASRKIQILSRDSGGRLFRIEGEQDPEPTPGEKPKKRRGPRIKYLTTYPMSEHLVEELFCSLNDVLMLIQHLETTEDKT